LMALLTPVMNGVWPMLLSTVQGIDHHIVKLGRSVRSEGPVDASEPSTA
jgi:hypothetical protein